MGRRQCLITIIFSLLVLGSSADIHAQRRQRPDSMKHTEADVENARKTVPVKCTYIRDGKTFSAVAWAVGMAGKMKIGDVTLTFSKGRYRLNFISTEVYIKESVPMWKQPRYNPWKLEKLGNDFIQEGRYETFRKSGKLFLRLYYGDTNGYISDIPLDGPDTTHFTLYEDDWLMEFHLV